MPGSAVGVEVHRDRADWVSDSDRQGCPSCCELNEDWFVGPIGDVVKNAVKGVH